MITLDHAGLSVANLDAARAFYARVFGFEVQQEFEIPGGIRGMMLRLESGSRFELFEHPASEAGPQGATPLTVMKTRGFGHVAISVPDIEAVFARALEAGATEMIAPAPADRGMRYAFFADPEGHLIELLEFEAQASAA